MKLFNRNIFALLASVSLLTSCSDDVLLRDKDNDGSESGIVFYVPNVPEGANPETGTRAIGNVNDFNGNEAEIKNLRVFAYKDGSENPITIDLKENGNLIDTDVAGYQGYRLTVDLENGEYEMYAIANSTISDNTTKSQLLAATATVPDDIAASGLPMSCSNARMEIRGTSGFTPVGSNKTITVESGKSLSIRANLKFAVSKVRVTVLNDLRPGDLMGEVKVNRHANSSSLLENGTVPSGTGSTVITGNYFTLNPADIPADILDMNIEKNSLTASTPTAGGSTPWLWQTVFYVPERLTQTATDGTSITMKIGETTKEQPLGDKDNNRALERSHFYDYIGTIDGKFLLDVQPWTPAILAGYLDGSYWLDVDKTVLEVSAGYNSELTYKANAPVSVWSPQYNNQDIYTFDTSNPNKILITLNSEIDSNEFPLMKAQNKWKYFTITAGTIEKKIEIKNLEFREFVTPSTDMVTIDVNERKSGGTYSGDIELTVRTNLPKIQFSKEDWESSADDGTPASLIIQDGNGNPISFNTPIDVPANGVIRLKVHYNDLNSNRELWKGNYDMKLNMTGVDNNGQVRPGTLSTVMVYVRSYSDTYKIHLKAPGWLHPHIYAYQILELPSDHPTNPNAPVGADKGGGGYTAALEYSFTGAVAFKGWNVGSDNNPTAGGKYQNGFYYFNSVLGDDESWDPTKNGAPGHYYLNMDFCGQHREELDALGSAYKCDKCCGTAIDKDWPGVHMKKEAPSKSNNFENDWWYFDLTGVATPGKTLIMFNDCNANDHDHSRNNNRYPGYRKNADGSDSSMPLPGVPLFDFPSKEGWFVYQGSSTATSFLAYAPGTEPVIEDTYTVYYTVPDGYNWDNLHCYYWNGGNEFGNTFPGTAMTKISNKRWSCQIPKAATKIIFNNGVGGKNNQTVDLTVIQADNHEYSGNVKTTD